MSLLNDLLNFLRDRTENPFSERNRTPFAGAYLFSFLIYNWVVFYSILTFTDTEDRFRRIAIIKYHFIEKGWDTVLCPLFYSFLSIIAFYFFSNLSLGITTFFGRWFKPYIIKFSGANSKIIDKESYNELEKRFNLLFLENDETKKKYINLTEDAKVSFEGKNQVLIQYQKAELERQQYLGKAQELEKQVNSLSSLTKSILQRVKSIYFYDSFTNFLNDNNWNIRSRVNVSSNNFLSFSPHLEVLSTSEFSIQTTSEIISFTKTFKERLIKHTKHEHNLVSLELNLQLVGNSKLNANHENFKRRAGEMTVRVGVRPIVLKKPDNGGLSMVYANNGNFISPRCQDEMDDPWDTITLITEDVPLDTFDAIEVTIEIKPGFNGDFLRFKDIVLFAYVKSR